MNDQSIRKIIREFCKTAGSVALGADKLRVSRQHLYDILHDRRRAGPGLLSKLGYERIEVIRKINVSKG